jgi:hypothetical protein
MAGTRRLGPRTTLQIRDLQRTLRAVLAAYPALGEVHGWLKAQIFADLRRELSILERLEDEILYPALEAQDPLAIARAREEHALIGRLVGELDLLTPGDGAFDFGMHLLADIVERHALMEEAEVFPLLEEIDAARQEALWEAFRARKRELRGRRAQAS